MNSDKTQAEILAKEEKTPVEQRVKDFTSLLDSINSLSDKKKALWKEIYENALVDRNNANIMLNDLFTTVIGKTSEHAIQGPNINKYIERMSKANDQLIRLAELIAEAEKKEEDLDPESIYRQIKDS